MSTTPSSRYTSLHSLAALVASAALVIAPAVLATDCSSTEETTPDAGASVLEGPEMLHGPPNEANGEMCVVCHICGTDGVTVGAPIISNTSHDACLTCHTLDGGLKTHSDGGGCEFEVKCDTNPPTVNCDQCHSVATVNGYCNPCHVK